MTGRRFSRTRKVRLGDAGGDGRLRLDALARYLQDIANDDAVDAGLEGAMAWVVRRIEVEWTGLPALGDLVELTTFCTGVGMERLGQTAVGRADVVPGRVRRHSQHRPRISHGPTLASRRRR